MSYFLFSLWREAILPAFLLSLLFLPATAFAVVGDVTLTGLPPNTTVSLTNEETKEKVEQKTDERGFVVIPMTGKKWQSGRHSVACQIDGKPVSSGIFLRDGANRVDLTALTLSARPLDPANRQKVDEALKKSSAILKANPKNSQALLTQGSALNRLARHGQALSKLAQAAKLGSTHPALAFETGWSLLRLGMYPQAIAQLEKYEKMKPGLGQTSEFIGRSHLYMGELDKADAKFNEALKRDPRLASTVRFHQAILETLRKNPQAASKHIASLLKEAPNSPTAQIFRNATLQPTGAKPSAPTGTTGKDYKLSDPIRIQLPPTTAGDVAAGVAKGVVGGLLGGLFGGGRSEPEGPNLVAKPDYPETMLTGKDGKTKINLSGALVDGKPNIVMGVQESPGNGAPHLMLLQDKNCNVLQPAETSVTAIWEQWMAWKLTVNWTKSYYENGRLVHQEKGSWSTPWHEFKIQVKDPSDLPGIWKDFNSKPFEGIREAVSTFDVPKGVPFNPADWNLITHATTDAGNNQLVTAPFVTGLGTDQNNNLTFKPMPQTACESKPPSDPLLAFGAGGGTDQSGAESFFDHPGPSITDPSSTTTIIFSAPGLTHYKPRSEGLPSGALVIDLTVQAPGANVTIEFARGMGRKDPTRIVVADYIPAPSTVIESRPTKGVRTETRPDGTKISTFPSGIRVVTRPDGSRIYTDTDGTVTETYRSPARPPSEVSKVSTGSSGIKVETRTDGTMVETFPPGYNTHIRETRPDGTIVTTYDSGIRVESRPDGTEVSDYFDSIRETRSDGTEVWTVHGGTVHVVRPDGTRTWFDPDGHKTESRPDGIVIRTYPSGTQEERRPDGTRVWTAEGETTEHRLDGTIVHIHPDGGRTEIRPGGVTIETDRDGKVVSTAERRLSGTQITTYPDGTRVISGPGGPRIETRLDGSETITHPDGTKTETTIRPDGTRVTTFPGGLKLESRPGASETPKTRPQGPMILISPEDGSTAMVFPDGRRIETRPDGTEIETPPRSARKTVDYAHAPRIMIESRPRTETRPDGTKIESFPDGTEIVTYADGRRIIKHPDGTKVTTSSAGTKVKKRPDVADYAHVPRTMIESRTRTETRPGGTKIESFPDGTEIVTHPDGLRIESRPNGTEIVTHPNGHTIERRPDGTSVSTYPDGFTSETRPDGTRITTRPGGLTIETRPDRTKIYTDTDGTVTTTRPGSYTTTTRPDGTKIETRFDGHTTETRPDGTKIESDLDGFTTETRPDGTRIMTGRDGVRVEIRPNGTRIDTRPDGTRTAYYPDGSRVEVGKDGSITFHDAPAPPGPAEETLKRWVEEQLSQPPSPTAPKETQPPAQPASPAAPKGTQPPPQPAGPPAPPSVLDFLDEAIVPS